MDADFLWKAIVPLGLLAIWALTAITNRDPKPLPNRLPANNPYGPRPLPPSPMARTSSPDKAAEIRWSPNPQSAPPPPKPGGFDEDIVIIESPRTLRPNPSRGGLPNRRNRGSRQAASPAVSAPSVSTKTSLATVSQSVNQQIASSLVIKPLSEVTVAQPVQRSASGSASQPVNIQGSSLGSGRIASVFADKSRLRDAIILNELLKPPLALRHKAHRS